MADWLSIKTEYVTSGCDLPTLAQKYGVSYSTIRKRSSKEHWAEQREEHQNNLGTLVAQKTAEKISDIEADIAAVKAKTRLALWKEIGRRMQNGASELEGADLRRMVQNYCDMNNAETTDGITDGVKITFNGRNRN
ncbi:hypothetical protein AALA99_13610 [Anaerotruncus colihominis]|uniref:hypothetical protein n=1 Tax=Anaerotruncus colihominis TaxID=169435 RepID=UPI0035167D59